MQFRLSTLFLLFVVLWSSLMVFGGWGVAVFILLVFVAIGIAGRTWILWTFLGLLLLMALVPFAGGDAREAAFHIGCNNQLKLIGLALYNYRQANGCFPPAFVTDKDGKPIHSWRVLILPYLEEQALYKQYNFNEPWDGPNNKKLLAAHPRIYACCGDGNACAQDATGTSYVAVVGASAAWTGKKPGKLPTDAAKTIILVETSGVQIPWTEPRDLDLDLLLAASPGCVTVSSKHFSEGEFFFKTIRAGVNVAMADGSTRFLPGGLLASSKFPDMLKVGGFREEYILADWSGGRRINWPNCAAFAVWLASSGWLLVRAVRSRKKAGASGGEEAQDGNTIAGS